MSQASRSCFAARAAAAIVAVTAFLLLTARHLNTPGLYYDELHQAVAAFDYLGRHYPNFNHEFHSIPILNTSYSGAIKSNIYGAYLRLVDPHFTITSWRLLGLLFAAGGLAAFYVLVGPALTGTASAAFAALFLTDVSLLLTTRHDWGPVALNLALRLALTGVWISALSDRLTSRKALVAGGLVGLATFEKLDAVVLLVPLGIFLALAPERSRRLWTACAIGLLLGAVPLAAANVGSFAAMGRFVSLAGLNHGRTPLSVGSTANFLVDYLALGAGREARNFIFGDVTSAASRWIEAGLLLAALVVAMVRAARAGRADWRTRAIGVLLGSYAATAVGLALLPRDTWIHHWVMGTPFQYAAIALATDRLATGGGEPRNRGRWAIGMVLGLLIVSRLAGVSAVEASITRGRASDRFSQSFTRVAELAASRSSDATFVAADWGTGIQVYCLNNAQDDLVYEPFRADDPAQQMAFIASTTRKPSIYVAVTGFAPQFLPASEAILGFMAHSPAWQEVRPEDVFQHLSPIRVRKFVRR